MIELLCESRICHHRGLIGAGTFSCNLRCLCRKSRLRQHQERESLGYLKNEKFEILKTCKIKTDINNLNPLSKSLLLELKLPESLKFLIKVYPLGNFSINESVRYKKHIMFGCLTFKQLWEFSFNKFVAGFFRIIGTDFISKIVDKYLFGLKMTKTVS